MKLSPTTVIAYLLAAVTVIGLSFGSAPAAKAGTCTTSSPITAPIAIDAVTAIANGGTWDGAYNLSGTASCPSDPAAINDANDRIDQTQAIGAALSSPVWLEPQEHFALSGGFGFTDGATAAGLTGIARIDKNWSAFAGGAVSTEGDEWAGRGGLRVGW
jgi:hypothetical protein